MSKTGWLPTTVILKCVCLTNEFSLGLHASYIKCLTLSECTWENDFMMSLCSQLTQLNSLCLEAGHSQQSSPSIIIYNKASPLLAKTYSFTNLTNLHIRGDHGSNNITVLLLLCGSPNLKIFTYKKTRCSDADLYGNWLQNKLFSCEFVRKLTCLELDAPFHHHNFDKLVNAIFLKKLSINIQKDMVHDLQKTLSNLKHFKCLEVGIIDDILVPRESNIMKQMCSVCPSLEKVMIHSPSYPRVTLVSIACFMLEEMQLFL